MRRASTPPRRAGFSLLAALVAIAAAGASLGPVRPRSLRLPAPAADVASEPSDADRDAELRLMILGRWSTQASGGTRVIGNRADGTASLEVTFDFFAGLLYGEKVQFDLQWSLERGELTYTMQGGRPAAAAARVMADHGRQATYAFRSIAPNRMHLTRIDEPAGDNIWTRIPENTK